MDLVAMVMRSPEERNEANKKWKQTMSKVLDDVKCINTTIFTSGVKCE